MPTLIICRHSISQPAPDTSAHQWRLTEEGHERCKILAAHLRPYNVMQIYTSHEPKAYLTGDLTAAALGIPCEAVAGLQETRRESVPYYDAIADFQAAVKQGFDHPNTVAFGEESFAAARAWFAACVDALLAHHPGDDTALALITHGTIMSLYLAPFTQYGAYDLWQQWDMPAYAVLTSPDNHLRTLVPQITTNNTLKTT